MSSECLCGFVPSSARPEGGEKGRDFWGSQRQALPSQASPRILGLSSHVGWPPEGSLHCWGTVILFKPRGHPRALDLSPLVVPQKLPFIHLLAGHSSFSGKLCHPLGSRDGQSWCGHGSRGGRNQQQRQRGEDVALASQAALSPYSTVWEPLFLTCWIFLGGCYIEGVLLTSNKEVAKICYLHSLTLLPQMWSLHF